jgi:uncharacterized protein YdaU (DUF1376 family)
MAYLRLIWHYYDTEKPLQNDPESLAFIIGASVGDVNLILKHYFILDGDSWRKTRCDSVIAEYHGKAEKAKKSADARWKKAKEKQSESESNANASPDNANESKIDANQKPITNNQEPREDIKNNTPQAALGLDGLDDSTTDKQKKATPPKFNPESLADEMPEKLAGCWLEWIHYRRTRKLSTKEPTWRAQAANLAEWGKAGHDPCLAIKASIENGWSGLFEPKKQGAATQYKTAAEKEAERNAYTFDLERARNF